MTVGVPSVEYARLSPMLIVFGAAVVGVVVEAALPRGRRYAAHLALASGALVAAFAAVVLVAGRPGGAVMGSVMADGPALFFQGAVVVLGMAALAPIAQGRLAAFAHQGSAVPGGPEERRLAGRGIIQTEVFPLFMLAVGGMLVFSSAADLLTVFVGLEVLSLPLYLLCGLARHRRLLSQEAALKYFLLGAFSSALLLYGVALLYGYAGTLTFSGIGGAVAARGGQTSLALTGVGLLMAGLLFKVGAVPFHSWVPDVYQGAPTPITALMAAATKIAAFAALARVCYVALPNLVLDWRPVLWAVAALTMVVAAVLTVTQTDIKRLLAYSSVANVGFLLLGFSGTEAGFAATMFYLAAYSVSTMGAFSLVTMIRQPNGEEVPETLHWAGLGRRSPAVAGAMSLFLLAIAGIPLTSGFVSKLAIFQAAASQGAVGLVVVGAVSSAIAAFAYARVIMTMFFHEPNSHTPQLHSPAPITAVSVAVAAAATVLLGVVPQPLFDLVAQTSQFLP
ncbi:NADH-quinone oxidoreductase subunit N [Mycobacterium sp. E2327]|uniref:NADH-quinone oxidoreductase subunit NuoN n=1 Tax=Mycobacterium sp. E2327 TaxID=1834132 RepID=UPI000800F5DC|nr:NADH-quinone oxidoreductase subunit NuoN [Mycobacterium sp. E2327]OBI17421.1 NADH-quinone oxidoreductase subunit N [Mycobacterium sp. E2327]